MNTKAKIVSAVAVAVCALAIALGVSWGMGQGGGNAPGILATTVEAQASSQERTSSGPSGSSATSAAATSSQQGKVSSRESSKASSKESSKDAANAGSSGAARAESSSQAGRSSAEPTSSSADEEVVVIEYVTEEVAPEQAAQSETKDASAAATPDQGSGSGTAPSPQPTPGTTTEQTAPAGEPAEPSASPETPETITVHVTFDSSNAHAFDADYPASLGTFDVQLPPGSTVFDALAATGVPFHTSGPTYVDSIGGIAEKQCDGQGGWMYAVDGEFPMKPANAYQLQGGEDVRWAYTVVEGDV